MEKVSLLLFKYRRGRCSLHCAIDASCSGIMVSKLQMIGLTALFKAFCGSILK